MQALYKSYIYIPACKYFVNKININHTGQCYRIRNQYGWIWANTASSFTRNTSHYVYVQWRPSPRSKSMSTILMLDHYPSYDYAMQSTNTWHKHLKAHELASPSIAIKTKYVLTLRVIWKWNWHRDMPTLMHISWMGVQYWRSCHYLHVKQFRTSPNFFRRHSQPYWIR